ncbi:MAG TPA: RdgB/HAM1 family non-canonical purine NTP pyrophosphatase [Armatimonadota bacterium]|nr:RdgB/HAM1 family non-canonical purine NTP pyrophosphatase [Armatimonadota bacterium]
MTLIAATNNPGKLKELRRLLEPEGFEILSMKQANITAEVQENAETYEGNAEIKALAVSEAAGMAVIADDSGLEVDALGGSPGIHTARYAGAGASSSQCISKLLSAMRGVPPERRTARFVCSICCIIPDKRVIRTTGRCEGYISQNISAGVNGFGYDPVFIEAETGIAFSQLTDREKDRLSHRGKAIRELIVKLKEF